ncbi:MAG: AI-2E family transporter [Bacteroidetes bacterium]|nr:MAG: AI-2E family transporter [Bacteroidota bacterium]
MPAISFQASSVRHLFFLLLLLFITVVFFGLLQPFLLAVFWSVVLAIVFYRPFRILRIRLRGRGNLAAGLTVSIAVLLVVVPCLLILLSLVNQGQAVVEKIQTGEWNVAAAVDYLEGQMPRINRFFGRFGVTPDRVREDLNAFATKAANALANQAMEYTQDAITLTAQFFLVLYLLFFFLRDGRTIIRKVVNVVPLGNNQEYQLLRRFSSVTLATMKGTVIVALIQGTLGGLLFYVVGIGDVVFWGVIMTLLSLLPIGGSGLVWGPAALYFLIQGPFWKGVVLLVVGAAVIGLVDNLLRPRLVGQETRMPDYLILLATLGGIAWFGLSGFILGPVIAAFFVTCWKMAGLRYGGAQK